MADPAAGTERIGPWRCQLYTRRRGNRIRGVLRGTVQSVWQLQLHAPTLEELPWVDALVERARFGDRAAFQQLAERAMPEVYRLAAAMVGADDGRDVAQESLVSAWRQLPTLRQPDRFESWLRSIVMNRARNVLRARRRHPTVALVDVEGLEFAEESVATVSRRLAIEDAFRVLSTEQREVLVLHYVVDLPLREVARVLGLREGTAKSRLHAGLARLREGMTDE